MEKGSGESGKRIATKKCEILQLENEDAEG